MIECFGLYAVSAIFQPYNSGEEEEEEEEEEEDFHASSMK